MGRLIESRRYEKAFRDLAADIAIETTVTLRRREHWSGFESSKTRRRNGTRVYGANRDIVDTGELSQSMRFKLSQTGYFTKMELSFSAPHYQFVRFGTRKMAGRDFVGRATARATHHQSIEQALDDRLRKFR